jgi:DNA-binding CsgD family transcriptional regulator
MTRHGVLLGSERPLLGRRAECETIAQLLDAVRDGLGGAMVLTGEPGVGKTRLLEFAAQAAGEVSVINLVGVESETRLAYGALHRMLRPLSAGPASLPPRQQEALGAAFGLIGSTPSDRFLVGLATLTVLSATAADAPLVCLIDDAHWLDRESVEALAFAARRLHADSLGMVFAACQTPQLRHSLGGLPELPLSGLDPESSRALLGLSVPGRLDESVADRIVAGTGGNPLALVETAGRLSPEQLAGVARLPDPLPVSGPLEDHFRASVAELPEDTRTLLLLMAVAPAHERAGLWRAAGELGLPVRAATPAVDAGILVRGAQTTFRHPLIRSAVYAAASPEDRHRIHAVLARTSAPDRRAWYLAETADGSDEVVAAELEAASARVRTRGGYSEQALFLTRAAELTTDAPLRAERYLGAATAHFISGDFTAARTALDVAHSDLRRPVLRARAHRIRASMKMLRTGPAAVPAMLVEAAREVGSTDPAMTRDLMSGALYAALVGGDRVEGTTLALVAKEAADALHEPDSPSWSPTPLLEGLARSLVGGYSAGAPVLSDALRRLRSAEEIREYSNPLSVIVSMAADGLWDIEAKAEIVERLAAVDRAGGALWGLGFALSMLATVDVWDGRFAAAEACCAEADGYAEATGSVVSGDIARVLLHAWTGDEPRLRLSAAAMETLAHTAGIGSLHRLRSQALSIFAIGSGRYDEALRHAMDVFVDDTVGLGSLILPTMVETGVRSGDRSAAEAALERMEERAPLAGTPWALGLLARCRALMDDGDAADELSQDSIDRLGTVPVAADLAWSRLLYGEWLRRRGRRQDARVQLRAAYESFAGWGAAPFAERARAELRATGETVRRRTTGAPSELTPQERQVATLASDGLTNVEIATRLFVTVSTVEFHLTRVFRKLGITSRRHLAAALGDPWGREELGQPAPPIAC